MRDEELTPEQPDGPRSERGQQADEKLPPVGLRPRWLANEMRAAEIAAAVGRYEAAGEDVPAEWRDELAALSGPSDADRAKAAELLLGNGGVGDGDWQSRVAAIAAALTEARAPYDRLTADVLAVARAIEDGMVAPSTAAARLRAVAAAEGASR